MSAFKCVLPVLLMTSLFHGSADAEAATTFYKTTYRIQVQYEMWRNGSTYWATEYETTNATEAQLMLQLFEAALADGSLSNIMNCGPDWIVVDVRMTTKKEWLLNYEPLWVKSATWGR